jgi:hypothetical protein
MSASLGRISARLVQPADEVFSPNLVDLINKNINPPTAVDKSDVYIGAMYVVSDEVNSFGGRFPLEEHERLAHLLVDSPVMVGHRKDKLPIGRNFHAVVVERDGKSWVKSYFYWLKSTEGAEALKKNIDGGIYKECSIGFTFLFPECSVCKKDIRTCPHEPFQRYEQKGDGVADVAYFNYRQIERVLETSLVYRGAVPDTAVSRELALTDDRQACDSSNQPERAVVINNLSELEAGKEYLLVPFYESLPIMVTFEKGALHLRHCHGELIDSAICSRFPLMHLPEMCQAYAHLVAYRGRERCSVEQLKRHLAGKSGPVTRLEIKLFPPAGLAVPKGSDNSAPNRIRMIRHRIAAVNNLDRSARSIMTRNGVQLWPVEANPWPSAGYQYRPLNTGTVEDGSYTLTIARSDPFGTLVLTDGNCKEIFQIRQFNLARLLKGGRFVADKVESPPAERQQADKRTTRGQVISLIERDEGIIVNLTGPLTGKFVLRPIQLDGRRRFLFYGLVS